MTLNDHPIPTDVSREITVIGHIRSPHQAVEGTPIQSVYAIGLEGRVIVDHPFADALDDIEGFERLWLIYWMNRASGFQSRVLPYRDTREHGLFATRSPCRPNPIGMSVVRLARREAEILHIVDIDVLDNTPLIDIKPYVPTFDAHPQSKAGWFDSTIENRKVADGRFHRPTDAK